MGTFEKRLGINDEKPTFEERLGIKQQQFKPSFEERIGLAPSGSSLPLNAYNYSKTINNFVPSPKQEIKQADVQLPYKMPKLGTPVTPITPMTAEDKLSNAYKDAFSGIADVGTKTKAATLTGIGNTDLGIVNALRMIDKPFSFAASKLEQFVTGKKVDPAKTITQKALTGGVEKIEKGIEDVSKPLGNKPNMFYNAVQSLPTTAAALLNPAVLFGVSAGQASRESEKEGANYVQQLGYGLGTGSLETATEMLPLAKLKTIFKGSKAPIKDIAIGAIEEFAGESTSAALQPFIKKAAYNPDAELATIKEIVDAGLTGSLAAVMMGGVGMGLNGVQTAVKNKDYSPETIQNINNEIKQATGVDILNTSPTQPSQQSINTNIQGMEQTGLETANVNAQTDVVPQETVQPVQQPMQQLELQPQYAQTQPNVDGQPNIQPQAQAASNALLNEPQGINEDYFNLDNLNTEQQITEAIQKAAEIEKNYPELFLKMNLTLFSEQAQEKLGKLRKTYSNSYKNAEVLPQEFKDQLNADDFRFAQVSNQDQWNNAITKVNGNASETLIDFMSKEKLGGKKGFDTAVGQALLTKYTKDGDFNTANKVAVKLARLMTDAGQTVQAMSILKKLTPEGQLYAVNQEIESLKEKMPKEVEKANQIAEETKQQVEEVINNDEPIEQKVRSLKQIFPNRSGIKFERSDLDRFTEWVNAGAFTEEKYKAIIEEKLGIPTLTEEETKFIIDTMNEAQEMEEGRNKDIELARIKKIITDKIPPNLTGRFAALQRLSMLFNAKTQVRNVVGNTLMLGLEGITETVRTPIDALVSLKTGEKTGTTYKPQDIIKFGKAFKQGSKYAFQDFKMGIDTRGTQGQFEIGQGKSFSNKNPVGKFLNKADSITTLLLTLGDRPFSEGIAAMEKNRLGRIDKYKNDSALLLQTANDMAADRTFQNRSWLAEKATALRNSLGIAGRIVLPFSYTPSNIADKVFDYTPIGSVRTIAKNIVWDSKQGKFDQLQTTQRAARNITGSALIFLGYLLAKSGIIQGAFDNDKDKKEFQKQTGLQDYAFKIGDTFYTFDWAQPVSVPFAIGVNIFQAINDEAKAKETIFNAIQQASLESAKTVLDQPLLMGIQKLFGGYNGSEGLIENAYNIAKQSPTQIVPFLSLARQAKNMTDPLKREYEYNDLGQNLQSQLPFASNKLPLKYDTLGEPIKNNDTTGLAKVFNVFFNPSIVSKESASVIETEILDIYDNVGDKDIFPKLVPNSFSYDPTPRIKGDSITIKLTSEEKSLMQKIMGETTSDGITRIMQNQNYSTLSYEQKNAMIKAIIEDAFLFSKKEIVDKR